METNSSIRENDRYGETKSQAETLPSTRGPIRAAWAGSFVGSPTADRSRVIGFFFRADPSLICQGLRLDGGWGIRARRRLPERRAWAEMANRDRCRRFSETFCCARLVPGIAVQKILDLTVSSFNLDPVVTWIANTGFYRSYFFFIDPFATSDKADQEIVYASGYVAIWIW